MLVKNNTEKYMIAKLENGNQLLMIMIYMS